MSNVEEKLSELLDRAQKYGISLVFDGGVIVVKKGTTDDPVRQRDTIDELGKYLVHLRALVERRAIGACGKKYLGQKIWLPDYGEGTLTEANDDGSLSVLVKSHHSQSPQALTARGENLLIIIEDSAVPADEELVSETPRKRVLGIF